jgi:hypothetical protein
MHMDRVLKQGRDYVEDVINNVRTCLWPDPSKHPNRMPRDVPSQPPATTVHPGQTNGALEKQGDDEAMSDAPATTTS